MTMHNYTSNGIPWKDRTVWSFFRDYLITARIKLVTASMQVLSVLRLVVWRAFSRRKHSIPESLKAVQERVFQEDSWIGYYDTEIFWINLNAVPKVGYSSNVPLTVVRGPLRWLRFLNIASKSSELPDTVATKAARIREIGRGQVMLESDCVERMTRW